MTIPRRFLVALVWCSACGSPPPSPAPPGEDAAVEAATCSADTLNDPANCGACGRACVDEQRCADGVCVARDPLDTYASCRAGTAPDVRCDGGRSCVSVGSGGPRVCVPSCALSSARCPDAPGGSDASVVCARLVLYCALSCTATTTCPAGQQCRFLSAGNTSGYCAG